MSNQSAIWYIADLGSKGRQLAVLFTGPGRISPPPSATDSPAKREVTSSDQLLRILQSGSITQP